MIQMNEYISKSYLITKFNELANYYYRNKHKRQRAWAYATAADMIKLMDCADVQPVKRGKWEEHHATYIKQLDAWFVQAKCSCCGRYSDKMDNYSQYLDLEYCSHCSADMKEGE